MQCEKCKEEFEEKDIHVHHIIPKHLGGTDKDGRIYLCYKCHIGEKGIHEELKELLILTPKSIKEFTEEWLKDG